MKLSTRSILIRFIVSVHHCVKPQLISIKILIFIISVPNLRRQARYRRDTYLGVGGHI